MSIEELKDKKNVSLGLIVGAVALAFNIGFIYANMISADNQIDKNRIQAKDFTEQEVGGLRADWERQNKAEKDRDDSLLKRIEKLEQYHSVN